MSISDNNTGESKSFSMLHAAKWYAPVVGGIETAAIDITGAVQEKADVKILVCSENKKRGYSETEAGVPVHRVKTYRSICSMPISFEYLRAFRKLSKEVDLIQIHAPFPLSDLALLLCPRRKRSKVAVWWHSDVVKQKKLMFFYKPLMHYMLRRADIIFVASKTIAEKSAYLGKYSDKVKVIPFGINLDNYKDCKIDGYLTDMLTDKKNIKLLFVGRLVYYKGMDILLEAMSKSEGAELFVIGYGELDEELRNKSVELGITDKVHFLGKVGEDELYSAFSDCDVFVLPSVSRSECFGLVQLEAMAYGKPIINTALPTGVPDVSIDGETGITVEPGDVDALARAIETFVNDDEKRLSYGKAAKKRCETHFVLKDMQSKLYIEYLKLLGK